MHLGRELVDVNQDALGTIQEYTPSLHLFLVVVVLSTFLFGVLTVLSTMSTYFLFRNRPRYRAVVLILASTLMLYASTVAYWASIIANAISAFHLLEDAAGGILDPSHLSQVTRYHSLVMTQSIVATTSLAVNMILGDAIVWWRAYILWRTRSVLGLGCVLVGMALALGIAGAVCNTFIAEPHPTLSLLYSDTLGAAFAFMSLLTNILATALIAVKAWQHKQLLLAYIGKDGSPEVMRAFLLLVESGTLYSVLWIIVAIYQALSLQYPDNEFVDRFSFFAYGCLTPVIAIYPTAIIFLVALNRSHLEGGFAADLSTAPVSTQVGPFVTTTTSFDVFSRHQMELPALLAAPLDSVHMDVVKNV
ncbi:hypothetical protein V8D89_007855 [Ganoderma adspersum]